MAISKIDKSSVSDEVFKQIKANIVAGTWKSGDKIPSEHELVDAMGVSRVSVRDAIQRFVGMGILTVKRGEGTYVNEIIPSRYFDSLLPLLLLERPEYLDVQEYRLMLEPQIARIAALKATDEDIQKLRLSVENLNKQVENDQEFGKEDTNFHCILAECTGNALLVKINQLIVDVMESAMQQAIVIVGYGGGIKYHSLILDSIEARNPHEAERLMYEHIKSNLDVHDGAATRSKRARQSRGESVVK